MTAQQVADQILTAAQAGNWRLAGVLALIASVMLVRWAAPKLHGKLGDFLHSDRGGSLLVLAGGVSGALGSAVLAGKAITGSVLVSGVVVGITASGGWNVFWDLFSPSDKPKATPAQEADTDPAKRVPPPLPPAAAIVFGLLLPLLASGCGFGKALGACELGKLPQTLQAAVVAVVDIVSSGAQDWESQLENLGFKLGPDQLSCIVSALTSSAHAAKWLPPLSKGALDRLQLYQQRHPAKKACVGWGVARGL